MARSVRGVVGSRPKGPLPDLRPNGAARTVGVFTKATKTWGEVIPALWARVILDLSHGHEGAAAERSAPPAGSRVVAAL